MPTLARGERLGPYEILDAIGADGKRFAVFPAAETAGPEKGSVHLTFLLNFFDELRRRAPAGGK
jgi:hypothetical protein